jgi:hypothetical protein
VVVNGRRQLAKKTAFSDSLGFIINFESDRGKDYSASSFKDARGLSMSAFLKQK